VNIYRGLFESSACYDNGIDINELKNNYIVLNSLDGFNDELDNTYDSNKESCVNCYHSDGKYCLLKNIDINEYTPLCWGYRDCFTMQPCSDFQYDGDIDEEYINDLEDAY
jgi:hypothetical protein